MSEKLGIRYWFNIKTGQFVQLQIYQKDIRPFNEDWVQMKKEAFDNLLNERNTRLYMQRKIEQMELKFKEIIVIAGG